MGLKSDITRYKKQLINRAAKNGVYENFGQNECRKLRDKYNPILNYDLPLKKRNEQIAMIAEFEDWCSCYVG